MNATRSLQSATVDGGNFGDFNAPECFDIFFANITQVIFILIISSKFNLCWFSQIGSYSSIFKEAYKFWKFLRKNAAGAYQNYHKNRQNQELL